MAFPWWLLTLTVLFQYKGELSSMHAANITDLEQRTSKIAYMYGKLILCAVGITAMEYHWNCSKPNEHQERHIPGIRQYPNDVAIGVVNGDEIHLYRVHNLSTECTGEVTAIEYCYQYYSNLTGEAVFNWTVLFFGKEREGFEITRIDNVESHPSSLPESDCRVDTSVPETLTCCDRKSIPSFPLDPQMNNFIFGVTESAQGNTHNASLLGFHSSLVQYRVDTMIVSKAGIQNDISVGYALPRPSVAKRGLLMLWFVIGKLVLVYKIRYCT